MNRKPLWATAASIVLLGLVAFWMYLGKGRALSGSIVEPPFPVPDFTLTGHTGEPVRLSEQRGRVILLFFGYTNCPDECPLTMANLKLAFELLGRDASRAKVLLITTDPSRDSPDALRSFVERFDPRFLGLTGTRQELERVWKDYGVTVMDGGESHSNYIYVIDPDGMLVETVLADFGPQDIAADIHTVLARH